MDDDGQFGIRFGDDSGAEHEVDLKTLAKLFKFVKTSPSNATYQQCFDMEMESVVDTICEIFGEHSDEGESASMALSMMFNALCSTDEIVASLASGNVDGLLKIELLKKIIEKVHERESPCGEDDDDDDDGFEFDEDEDDDDEE